jgi:hypothetical protein
MLHKTAAGIGLPHPGGGTQGRPSAAFLRTTDLISFPEIAFSILPCCVSSCGFADSFDGLSGLGGDEVENIGLNLGEAQSQLIERVEENRPPTIPAVPPARVCLSARRLG